MKSKNRSVVIQSLLVAFFADIRCINWGLTQGGFVGEGVMSALYVGVVGLIVLSVLFSSNNIISGFSGYSIFLPLYLLLFYALTTVLVDAPVVSIPFFLIFTITAFLIPFITRVDSKLMLKAMMIYPCFAILRLQSVFASSLSWKMLLPMDVSYGYLVPIVANIVYLKFYYKGETFLQKCITLISSLINLVFFIYILLFGSRGPLLCIFLLLCVLWCLKIESSIKVSFSKLRLKVIIIAGLVFMAFFVPLLSFIEGELSKNGIEIEAISKMIRLQDEDGDLSNGRNYLNTLTWDGILASPLLGNGLDQFDNNYPGESYPHNFLLQILYDGGIWLFLILSPIFIRSIKFLRSRTYNEYAMYMTLFFASVPGALFSQDLWAIPILWMFFGLSVSKIFVAESKSQIIYTPSK